MNKEKLLEMERKCKALIDSLTAEELEAELRRIEEYERFINALREAGLGSVAIEVLPDGEAEDDEDEHTERFENDHEAPPFGDIVSHNKCKDKEVWEWRRRKWTRKGRGSVNCRSTRSY